MVLDVGLTETVELVELVFHVYVAPPETERMAIWPSQIVVGPVTDNVGSEFTTTVEMAGDAEIHPEPSVPVTE